MVEPEAGPHCQGNCIVRHSMQPKKQAGDTQDVVSTCVRVVSTRWWWLADWEWGGGGLERGKSDQLVCVCAHKGTVMSTC